MKNSTTRHYQQAPTTITWGCGHSCEVDLVVDVVEAAEQLAAYTQIDCLSCAKAAKLVTRGICWSDR